MSKKRIKPLIIWAFVLAGLAAVVVQAKGTKVEVLHNGKCISVSANAYEAHINHGDDDCDTGGGAGASAGGAAGAV